jgi:hypothetical protein
MLIEGLYLFALGESIGSDSSKSDCKVITSIRVHICISFSSCNRFEYEDVVESWGAYSGLRPLFFLDTTQL